MTTAADEAARSAGSVADLRSAAASSAKWAVLQVLGATGGRLLFTFALARFLGPEDFGIVAAGMIYVAFAMLVLDQGFGAALVQRREVDGADVRSVATLNVILAVVLSVVTIVVAPAAADFFNTPQLTGVLRVLAIGLVVRGLAIVPTMLCRRAFMFRELAVVNTGSVVVGGVAGMLAAAGGAGYWSLVVQSLVGDGLLLVCLFALQGLPRFGLQLTRLRSMFGFSIALLGANCMMFVGQNADTIAIGRALGATALAYYALAFRIQRFPLQFIGSAVNDVALPIFSRLQQDPVRRESWFFTATRFVMLLTWPTLVLLAVSADIAIPFLFGPDWSAAIVPLQLLSLGGLSMISRWMFPPLLTSSGHTGIVFGWSLANVGLFVIAIAIAVQWGVNAVAASVGITALLLAVPQSVHVSRVMHFSGRRFAASHVPVAIGCIALAIAWRGVAHVVGNELGTAGTLIAATAVAIVIYLGTVRLMWPGMVADTRAVLTLSRERRRQPEGASAVSTATPHTAATSLRHDAG